MTDSEEIIGTVAQEVWDKLINDTLYGRVVASAKQKNIVSTGFLLPSSIETRPSLVRDFVFSSSSLAIITDPNITISKGYYRERKRTFWQKLWDSFWCSVSPWPYTPVEFCTEEIPAMMYDSKYKVIYCHPALRMEIEKNVNSGGI